MIIQQHHPLPYSPKCFSLSLNTPPVTARKNPPNKYIHSQTSLINSKLGPRTLKVAGHRYIKTSKEARIGTATVRSVTVGNSAKPLTLATSLVSRKSNDFKRGKLQTAAMALTIACSVSDVTPILLWSQTLNHLAFSRKNVISIKGRGSLVGNNILLSSDPRSTDPAPALPLSFLSSNTALAVNDSLLNHSELQVTPSIPDDLSVLACTGNVEGVTHLTDDNKKGEKIQLGLLKQEIYILPDRDKSR